MLVVHPSRGRASLGVVLSASLVSGVSCLSSCKISCFSFALSLTTGKVSTDDTSHTRCCCMGRELVRHFSLYRQLREPRERPESLELRVCPQDVGSSSVYLYLLSTLSILGGGVAARDRDLDRCPPDLCGVDFGVGAVGGRDGDLDLARGVPGDD